MNMYYNPLEIFILFPFQCLHQWLVTSLHPLSIYLENEFTDLEFIQFLSLCLLLPIFLFMERNRSETWIIWLRKISPKLLGKIKVFYKVVKGSNVPMLLEVLNGGYIATFQVASDWCYIYHVYFSVAHQIPSATLVQKHSLNARGMQGTHRSPLFTLNQIRYRRISE